LILEKRMDSLAKSPALTGTLPFDSRAESIWATGSASDGSGKVRGVRAAVWRRRRRLLRRRGSGSPELGVPAAPVAEASRLLAREDHRGTGRRPRATAGPRGARASRATVRGGGHHRRAAFQGLRPAKAYGGWRKITRKRRGDAPKGCGGRGGGGRRRTTTTGGGRARLFAGDGDAGVPQVPRPHGRLGVDL
jgi:hypothetical protein